MKLVDEKSSVSATCLGIDYIMKEEQRKKAGPGVGLGTWEI